MQLRLVPVVELEPTDLGVQNFVELLESGEWEVFWEAHLVSFGLRPIRPGSWFVATGEFASQATFNLLARVHLEWDPQSLDLPPELDHIGPISGGYAFVLGGSVQLEPGCCCDLSDLTNGARDVKATQCQFH